MTMTGLFPASQRFVNNSGDVIGLGHGFGGKREAGQPVSGQFLHGGPPLRGRGGGAGVLTDIPPPTRDCLFFAPRGREGGIWTDTGRVIGAEGEGDGDIFDRIWVVSKGKLEATSGGGGSEFSPRKFQFVEPPKKN